MAAPPALRSFWEGLSSRSLASSIAIVAFALAEFVFCCVFVTPPRVARLDLRRIMEDAQDEYARLTVRSLAMRYAPHRGLTVAYAGTSTARLSLLHGETPKLLQDYLAAQVGEPVSFYTLVADSQTLHEAVVVSDQLPEDFRGVMVLMISDTRNDERNLTFRIQDRKFRAGSRVALDSAAGDEVLSLLDEKRPVRTGIYFVDHLAFFAVRRFAGVRLKPDVLGQPLPDQRFVPPGQRRPSPAQHQAMGWERVRRDFEERPRMAIFSKYLPVLEALVNSWKRRGITGIIIEAPANPLYDTVKGEAYRREYEVEMRRFADRMNVTYWDLNPELSLVPADFADHIHLAGKSARFRFQAAFLRKLAPVLKEAARPAAPAAR
jgi:hypothetical protein